MIDNLSRAQFTAADKHREVLRELKMRKRVCPRWVEKGTMTAKDAARQIAIMEAIAADYADALEQERLI
jgi:hypothetical protein